MLTLISPAKINLFLHVVGRRNDGYHDLASLFQAINLCDVIHFVLSDQNELTCTDPAIPTDGSNLILKAANLFCQKTGLEFGVRIHLEKNIPYQAGLGGGSSNAATTLWALNELCGHPASVDQLAHWSSEIGSDIPFFFSEGSAYCSGRGERVRALPALSNHSQKLFWIVKPKAGLSTPQVFHRLNLAQVRPCDPELCLAGCLNDASFYFNDLEEPAFSVLPDLADLKAFLLDSGFSPVVMTGSGSAFFCFGPTPPPAIPDVQVFSVTFLNRTVGAWYSAPIN